LARAVGGLAATLNFLSHRKPLLSSLSLLGLSLIFAANAPHGAPLIKMLPHDLQHALHCGTLLHRVTNIMGCGLLLSSNYAAHKIGHDSETGGGCADPSCSSKHNA